ncbi:MAG: lysyl-tRNA synthetase class 2 [Planctomycetaceae bacterium]|jgi:lysyl-tRNA synthetase class 2
MTPLFLPTASLETLKLRSHLVASLRDFFRANDYWECETPVMSREVIIDANLDPFVTHDVTGDPYFLQTSPEAGMKRLLSAGAEAIFQITRAMRRGESGQLHNPEFTMVEWYRVGDDHHAQMDFVERLVRAFYAEATRRLGDGQPNSVRKLAAEPFERLTYDEAFERFIGTKVLRLSSSDLRRLAVDHQVAAPVTLHPDDRDGWLNLLLAELVEPNLGRDSPQFIYDYPASQAALAKNRQSSACGMNSSDLASGSLDVAERFELYDRGVELCNGYHELTDAEEFRIRTDTERENSDSDSHQKLPGAPLLAEAMQHGLPGCAGVALGLDRLVMLALGKVEIADVIAFPSDRA